MAAAVTPEIFAKEYASVFEGDERWQLAAGADRRTSTTGTTTRPTCRSRRS